MPPRKKAAPKPPPAPPPPRADGLIPHRITWGRVGIGHVILSQDRKWTVIDAREPTQYQYGQTCWFKVRAPRGEEHAITPKMKRNMVTVLLEEGATHPAPAYAQGGLETSLLESMLGGVEIATRDEATGETWCPWFPGFDDAFAAELLHLQIGHGMVTDGVSPHIDTLTRLHDQAHDRKFSQIGKGGFPHRHVPEDLSIT